MLTYPLEERGPLSLYEYLCQCIRADILSGKLPAGSRLPSKRALADHLHVSVITVEGAYSQLVAEGYVYSRPRRGFFAAAVERSFPAAQDPPVLPETAPPRWRLDLGRDQVDTTRFPVSTWARLTRQVLSDEPEALLSPAPHQGLFSLREAIARDLREGKGMAVSPEQIIIGAGAEYLYLLLAQLLGRETVFAVEDPGYPRIRQVYRAAGAVCVPIPLDAQGIDPAALSRSGAGALHISPNHQYPTGRVTPIARRQTLLRWAAETGSMIVEDDYDSEFRWTGRPLPTLQSIDTQGRVVYLNTFSQTISPAMRLGFLVLPPWLLARYRRELGFYACTVPALEQRVLTRFIAGGYYERHLSRMRKEYRDRRAAVMRAFRDSSLAQRVTFSEEGAGLHFLWKLDTDCPDTLLRTQAAEQGVRLRFLSEYTDAPSPETAHTLVVNYAGLSPDRLPEALRLLETVLMPFLT